MNVNMYEVLSMAHFWHCTECFTYVTWIQKIVFVVTILILQIRKLDFILSYLLKDT